LDLWSLQVGRVLALGNTAINKEPPPLPFPSSFPTPEVSLQLATYAPARMTISGRGGGGVDCNAGKVQL